MKLFLFLICFSSFIYASDYSVSCSNSKGTIVYNAGHVPNTVKVGPDIYSVTLMPGADYAQVTFTEEVALGDETKNSCDSNKSNDIGFYSNTVYEARIMKITVSGGVTRAEDKNIEARVICETTVSNIMPCDH